MKKTSISVFNNIKKNYIKLKFNPSMYLKELAKKIKQYFYENKMFVLFVFLNVLNGFLLRYFTLGEKTNIFDFRPLLADFSFVVIVGAFSYFMKKKTKFVYLFLLTLIMSIICMINSSYYTFYTSFSSISLLSTAKFITAVGDAVVENVLQPKDLIYIMMPIIFLYFNYHYKKSKYYEKVGFLNKSKKLAIGTIIFGCFTLFVFTSSLTATDIGRFTKQWNREYVVMKFGIYVYHVNDLVKSVEPKLAALFGYDNALKNFNEYYSANEKSPVNEYTDIFAGKNIIAIHAESMQNFVIGLEFNGVEVTPNLNKLAATGRILKIQYMKRTRPMRAVLRL